MHVQGSLRVNASELQCTFEAPVLSELEIASSAHIADVTQPKLRKLLSPKYFNSVCSLGIA